MVGRLNYEKNILTEKLSQRVVDTLLEVTDLDANPATDGVEQVEWGLGSIMEEVVVTASLPSPICRKEIRKTSVDVDKTWLQGRWNCLYDIWTLM